MWERERKKTNEEEDKKEEEWFISDIAVSRALTHIFFAGEGMHVAFEASAFITLFHADDRENSDEAIFYCLRLQIFYE